MKPRKISFDSMTKVGIALPMAVTLARFDAG
jgi:hypothetical protein